MTFDSFLDEVKALSERIVSAMEIPPGGITLRANISKSGTTYSLCVSEPHQGFHQIEGYPRVTPFLKIVPPLKTRPDEIRLEMSVELFEALPQPADATFEKKERRKKKDDGALENTYYYQVTYSLASPALGEYVQCVARRSVETYRSIEPWFGCCHRYAECSEARKCLHPNRLYSTACAYRGNLEKGRIFYGKNASPKKGEQ